MTQFPVSGEETTTGSTGTGFSLEVLSSDVTKSPRVWQPKSEAACWLLAVLLVRNSR